MDAGSRGVARMRAARDIRELRDACAATVRGSPHVEYRPGRLCALAPLVRDALPIHWGWMFDPRSATDAERLFDAAFNASLNGGYFDRDPATGLVRQWQVGGSGSRALEGWIAGLREAGLMPGRDASGSGPGIAGWKARVASTLVGVPYAAERLAIVEQFADPDRRRCFDALAAEALSGGGLSVDLGTVDRLAAVYPAGFAADPLRKKAILAFLLLAGNMAHRGLPVDWSAGFPADYQLPRGCAWRGVLDLSPEIRAALRDPSVLLSVDGPEVFHVRAATFVAVEELAERTGTPSWLVDGALFMGFRNDPAFAAEAPPPMRVDGDWF